MASEASENNYGGVTHAEVLAGGGLRTPSSATHYHAIVSIGIAKGRQRGGGGSLAPLWVGVNLTTRAQTEDGCAVPGPSAPSPQ